MSAAELKDTELTDADLTDGEPKNDELKDGDLKDDATGPGAEELPLVVVADDDEDIRLLVSLRLRRSGFRVVEAADGLEALKAIVAHDPDLVVLDVMMPGLDGRAVMRILNAKEGRRTRVIFLSARASVEDRVAGLELGAADYLTKPFEAAELVARARAALRA